MPQLCVIKTSSKKTPQVKNLLIALSFLIGTAIIAQPVNQTDSNGKKHGEWKKYHKNKKLRYVGTFEHGVPVGTFTYYYPTGQKQAVNEFRGKTNVCYSRSFTPEGKLLAEGVFKNEMRDSTWRYYDEVSGKLISEVDYQKGGIHGREIVYYPEGNIAKITEYKQGKKHGKVEEYYEHRKPKMKAAYEDDLLQGEATFYDVEGKIRAKGKYLDGTRHGVWYFFDNGKLEKKKTFHRGIDNELRNKPRRELSPEEEKETPPQWPE